MPEPVDRARTAVAVTFLQEYVRDRAAGRVRPLSEYQARYAGHESVIAAELAAIEGAERPQAGACGQSDGEAVPASGRDARADRYRDAVEIGHGGMGSVLRVWDPDLQRAVAMKVLGSSESRHATGDVRRRTRFLEEARIAGRLQHPGVAPVHELGTDGSGRPYFTMPLIQGVDLREIIERVHRGDSEWRLPRALGMVQRVCETVAYAHSNGVIHRDLKPANVMVGAFGETYVMDWGLARVLDEPERKDIRLRAAEGPQDEGPADSPLLTMEGDVVGTPAYMPPEQARGEIERVGRQADVYAIGAMLYHLLSGVMPYTERASGAGSRAVLARLLEGPPRPLRETARGTPPELVAICEKAMAREPAERYAGVAELGADLRAFLETRVVRAYEAGAFAELRKWIARNRALALTGAAAVLALVVGLVFSLLQKAHADAQAALARSNFGLARNAVREMLTEVGDETLADIPQMDPVRRSLLQKALTFHLRFLESRGDDPSVREDVAQAYEDVGAIRYQLGESDEALAAQEQAIAVLQGLVQEQTGRADLELRLAWARTRLAVTHMESGRFEEAEAGFAEALRSLEETRPAPDARHDRDRYLALTLSNLGVLDFRLSRAEEAVVHFQRAVEILDELLRARPDSLEHKADLAHKLNNLGAALITAGRGAEAEAEAVQARAVALYEELVDAEPDSRLYRQGLGRACSNLGGRRSDMRRPDAESLCRRAVELARQLVAEFPDAPSHRNLLGSSLQNLGAALRRSGALDEARRCAEEAIREQRVVLEREPGHAGYRRSLHNHYVLLMRALRQMERHAELAGRAEELAIVEPEKWQDRWSAAIWLTRCMALVERDEGLDAAERTAQRESYAARAVACLQAAVEGGMRDPAALEHAELGVLREREDFRRVVEAMSGAGAPQAEAKRR